MQSYLKLNMLNIIKYQYILETGWETQIPHWWWTGGEEE